MKPKIQFTNPKMVTMNKKMGVVRVTNNAKIYIDDIPELRYLMNISKEIDRHVTTSKRYLCEVDGRDYINVSASAKAKCHPSDTFNENTGFLIADTRSQKKVYQNAEKFFDDIMTLVDRLFYNNLSDRLTCYGDMIYRCEDHENEIIGVE